MFYSIPLAAGVEYVLNVPGRLFLLDDTGVASTVQVKFLKHSAADKIVPGRKKAFKAVVEFDSVALLSTVAATVSFFVSFNEVDIGLDDGVHMFVDNADTAPVPVKTPAGQPLEVQFVGVVAPVLGVVTVDNTDVEAIPVKQQIGEVFDVLITNANATAVPVQQQALSTIDDKAPVTVGIVATALVSDATLKRLRIRNSHATAVIAIGGAGVTLANGAVQLQPGDTFIEEDAAGAEWYAISDTAGTIVQIQGLK